MISCVPYMCHDVDHMSCHKAVSEPYFMCGVARHGAEKGDRGARVRALFGFKVFAASWPLGLGGDYLLYKLSRVQRGKLCGSHDPTEALCGGGGTLTQDTPAARSPLYTCSKSMLCETQLFPGA